MNIPDLHLFMMCESVNKSAFRDMPRGYYVRNCRESELHIWKAIHFDDEQTAMKYDEFMSQYFNEVYSRKGQLFFEKCLFVCDEHDQPIATCFIWKAYDLINTLHWFKVIKNYEGMGIGRALLTVVMQQLIETDYPIYVHTHPSSFRAIKLYADFGFRLLTDPIIGYRKNDLKESLYYLEKYMPQKDFHNLQMTSAPSDFFICGSFFENPSILIIFGYLYDK